MTNHGDCVKISMISFYLYDSNIHANILIMLLQKLFEKIGEFAKKHYHKIICDVAKFVVVIFVANITIIYRKLLP